MEDLISFSQTCVLSKATELLVDCNQHREPVLLHWSQTTLNSVDAILEVKLSMAAVPALRAGQWEAYHCARSQQAAGEHHVLLQGHGPLHGERTHPPAVSCAARTDEVSEVAGT